MNDEYITLKSGSIIRNDITIIVPHESNSYIVVFSGGQSVYISIDDYKDLKERLISKGGEVND